MRRILTFKRERCLSCRTCELACAVAHSKSRILEKAIREKPLPRARVVVMATSEGITPLRCAQCQEPLCAFTCKSGALHRAFDDGMVHLDPEQCVGCWMCLTVCPEGVRPDAEAKRIVRCDACLDRGEPECVRACPMEALGVVDEAVPRRSSDFHGRLVVVGASAAGIAACEAARESAPRASITLVALNEVQGASRPLLPYLLARKIPKEARFWRHGGFLEKLEVRILKGARAVGIDTKARLLKLEKGEPVPYDRLVIATGARPVMPDLPGSKRPGVFGLRSRADLQGIERRIRKGGKAVVLGGGNVGLQTCEALLTRDMKVAVVVRSPHLLSQMADEKAARRVEQLFKKHGLDIRTGCDAVEILGKNGVSGVRLHNGKILNADFVIAGKGIQPNVEWLKGSDLRVGRGISVDPSGRTNVPGIFAAGDCAETEDPITRQPGVSGIWPIAHEMGRAAGLAAVGEVSRGVAALRMNASRFFDTPIVSIGEVREERLDGARTRVLASTKTAYRKVVYRDGCVCGAILFGNISGAGLLYRLYRQGARVGNKILRTLDDRTLERTLLPFAPTPPLSDTNRS